MVFLLQKTTSVPVISFDTQHFLNLLMRDSGEMSFQAVLLMAFLCFLLMFVGSSQMAVNSTYRLYSHQQLKGHAS